MLGDKTRVPVRILTGLHRYINQRVETGGFLRAVLENDFMLAMLLADEENTKHIADIAAYIYHETPSVSHGSPEAVNKWLNRRELPYPDPAHACTICHKNWVDSDNGRDTCEECLRRV